MVIRSISPALRQAGIEVAAALQHAPQLLQQEKSGKRYLEAFRQGDEENLFYSSGWPYSWEYWRNPAGQCIHVSPSCEDITGYAAEEFLARPDLLLSIAHPDDRMKLSAHFQAAFISTEAMRVNFRIVAKNGTTRWISHICQPIYDAKGCCQGRRSSNRDITDLKTVEERLAMSENRLRLALDASSDGVWDRNLMTDEVYCGDNWLSVLGFTAKDCQELRLSWEELLHAEDKSRVLKAREEHILGRTNRYEVAFRMRNKAGKWQWILSRGKVIEWDTQGRPLRFIGTHTDITKHKEMESELDVSRRELERRIKERTAEVAEMNVALGVLLKKREQDKDNLEKQILSNVSELVEPYLDKLTSSRLDAYQRAIIDTIQSNIKELIAPFAQSLPAKFQKLTPTEMQIANLVKLGKTTKEIAELLRLSPGTVHIHRKHIRKKLGLTNQKTNLQSVLT